LSRSVNILNWLALTSKTILLVTTMKYILYSDNPMMS